MKNQRIPAMLCLAALLCALALSQANTAALAEVSCPILSVEDALYKDDLLITFNDSGTTRYGIFHIDNTITPMYLMGEKGMRSYFFPDVRTRLPYSFGILPNCDYYEQVDYEGLLQGGVRILSRSGDVLYLSPSGAAERIVGAEGDIIVFLRRVSSMTENTWKLVVTDHRGNELFAPVDIGSVGSVMYTWGLQNLSGGYFGMSNANDGIMSLSGTRSAFFDANTNTFFTTDKWSKLRPFDGDDQSALWEHSKRGNMQIWPSDLASASQLEAAASARPTCRIDDNSVSEGFFRYGNTYYRYSGEAAFDAPSYGGASTIAGVGNFYDGYAPVMIRGADGRYYVTLLNRDGEPLYDPVRLEGYGDFWGFSQQYLTPTVYANGNAVLIDRGYVLYEAYRDGSRRFLITPSGETVLATAQSTDLLGFRNGYVITDDGIIRASDPAGFITSGFIETPVYDTSDADDGEPVPDLDYNEVWCHEWIEMDRQDTSLTITPNGDGRLHMAMSFGEIGRTFEADFDPVDYETVSFEIESAGLWGFLFIEIDMGSRLYMEMHIPENDPDLAYFTNTGFIYLTDNPPDLALYARSVPYPTAEQWSGDWTVTANGHTCDLTVLCDEETMVFTLIVTVDGAAVGQGTAELSDPWMIDVDLPFLTGFLSYDTEGDVLLLSDAASHVFALHTFLEGAGNPILFEPLSGWGE